MMKFLFPLLFLALSSALPIDDELHYYCAGNCSKILLGVDGGYYYLVFENNLPALVFNANATLVYESSTIGDTLLVFYNLKGINESTKLSNDDFKSLRSAIYSFNASRAKEYDCKHSIGTDIFPCDDFKSCLSSCYAPRADALCHSQRLFIVAIWAFENQTRKLDELTNSTLLSLSMLEADQSDARFSSALSNITGLYYATFEATSNPLFTSTGYRYCPVPPYNLSALSGAYLTVKNARDSLFPLNHLKETIAEIESRAKERGANATRMKNGERCGAMKDYAWITLLSMQAQNASPQLVGEFGGKRMMLETACGTGNIASAEILFSELWNMSHNASAYEPANVSQGNASAPPPEAAPPGGLAMLLPAALIAALIIIVLLLMQYNKKFFVSKSKSKGTEMEEYGEEGAVAVFKKDVSRVQMQIKMLEEKLKKAKSKKEKETLKREIGFLRQHLAFLQSGSEEEAEGGYGEEGIF